MKTERLYDRDGYLAHFEGRVAECEKREEDYYICLNRTAFFPEGGGQAGDTGHINGLRVYDTRESEGKIYHVMREALKPGCGVEGTIDFKQRFSRMQQHSGEHIVSGLIQKWFGYDNVGFHLGKDIVTMDFNGIFEGEELKEIEIQANQIVYRNLEISITYPIREVLEKLEYRSKKEIDGPVRIVLIPETDVCACCAPHVRFTGEIGIIKLTDAVHYKGGTRVSMLCGSRALEYIQAVEKNLKESSVMLSSGLLVTAEAVKRQKDEVQQYKDGMYRFQAKYLDEKLLSLEENTESFLLFEEELEPGIMRRFVNEGMKKAKTFAGCFVGNDAVGYRFVIGSGNEDAREVQKRMSEAFETRGGGSARMVQGSVNAKQEDIRKILIK